MHNIFKVSIEKTFFISSLPFIGYLLAYIYQLAYYSFFNVPSIFIRVGIEEIIRAIIPIFGLSALVIIIVAIVTNSSSNKPTHATNLTDPNDIPPQKLNYWQALLIAFVLAC